MLGPDDDADPNAALQAKGPAPQPRALGWRRLIFLGPPRPPAARAPTTKPLPVPEPRSAKAAVGQPANAHTLPAKLSPKITLRASIAELMLVSKLRARSLLGRNHPNGANAEAAREVAREAERKAVLERYAHILAVTCKNWFPPETTASPPATHQRRL